MWSYNMLKTNAKAALKRYYWTGFLVSLLYTLAAGISGGFQVQIDIGSLYRNVRPDIALLLSGAVLLMAFIGLVCGICLSIFVLNPLEVGKNRFYMESREYPSKITNLARGFKKQYLRTVKTLFFRDLYVVLWSLLLIVPGIVKAYQYYMVPYLLAENPDMDKNRALELSTQMTDGEKMRIFLLDLSFIGWYLLGVLLCGVGTLFVTPYVEATHAELYALMRAKAFAMGYSNEGELPGFAWKPDEQGR